MEASTGLSIYRSEERGFADHGWLKSRHSFSFADFRDPAWMGFRALRVINEDRVEPSGGFPEHPHHDMEIFSYVVDGQLAHRDSLGNQRTLVPGEIQVMSAGTGVTHSEFNPSPDRPVHFLQIWIVPKALGLSPRYSEWRCAPDVSELKRLAISADGRGNSARIASDADIWELALPPGESTSHQLASGRGLWLQVIRGEIRINGQQLSAGDAAFTENPAEFSIMAGDASALALLFDLGS